MPACYPDSDRNRRRRWPGWRLASGGELHKCDGIWRHRVRNSIAGQGSQGEGCGRGI